MPGSGSVPPRWTPTLDDFVDIAGFVLRTSNEAVRRLPRLPLAESALHAPFASFGGTSAYADVVDQAAVLLERLVRNHPLPDGNKRAAFLMTARFLEANGLRWSPQDVATDATLVEQVAAGAAGHADIVAWIHARATAA